MTPAELAGRVEAAGRAIAAELEGMPDELASWHPAEGEWCIKEVLGHLLLTERLGFSGRVTEILSAADPTLHATPPAEPACGRDLPAMLAELREQRSRSVAQVASLTAADLERAGTHERVGRLTVGDILHEWVYHDRAHLEQILAVVRARVWPSMGGTQRFSR